MTVNPIFTRATVALFKKMPEPTNFFSSMFESVGPTNQFKISVDIVREDENIAVDIVPGSGAETPNKHQPFTNKEYVPPEYDEMYQMSAEELNKRLAGVNAFAPVEREAATAKFVADSMRKAKNRILRAIELQSVQALTTGIITLANGENVDFKQKASHKITAAVPWSTVTADALKDIEDASDENRKDGQMESDMLVMGQTAIREFLALNQIKDQLNFRRADLIDIVPPSGAKDSGAKFHGLVSVGPYEYQIWSYPQVFTDGSGTKGIKYMPIDKVIVMNSTARFDKYFGAIHRFTDGNAEGAVLAGMGSPIASSEPVEFAPYVFLGDRGKSLEVGIRSRPLVAPTDIDSFSVLTT